MSRRKNETRERLKAKYPRTAKAVKFLINKRRAVLHFLRSLPFTLSVIAGYYAHPERSRKYRMTDSGEEIPVRFWVLDNRLHQQTHITEERYTQVLRQIEDDTFAYYGKTYSFIKSALHAYPIAGKTVLISGLEACNCDMISVHHGASTVYAADYQPVIHDHPRVFSYSVHDFEKQGIQVDAVFSISSFEHDGLGRYGDPLIPDGDLIAMRNIRKFLKDDGILFLAVPVGADCIVINAHRIYGKLRLPMLLEGWEMLDAFGYDKAMLERPVSIHSAGQPVFVLGKCDAGTQHGPNGIRRQPLEGI